MFHNWVTIGAIVLIGISSIIANISYNKFSDNCTKYGNIYIALYFVTVLNFATDILTAFVMAEYYRHETTYRLMSTILTLASLITITIPYILNVFVALKHTKSFITLFCIILSGDSYTSLRLNKNKTLSKSAKWMTMIFQNATQIGIQAVFMIIILKTINIVFIISIIISLFILIEGLVSFRHKISKVRKYAAKLQFSVTEDEKKSMKKNKLNKNLKSLLHLKLTDALLINKDQARIGDITFDENCVEIEIIHSIPHEIGNDIEYVSNMYHDQMDKIGGIISQIYELYNSTNIKPQLITDKSSAIMIMNSTSFRSIPIVTTPSTLELDGLKQTTESKPDEEQIMNENSGVEKHGNDYEDNSQENSDENSVDENKNETDKNNVSAHVENNATVIINPDLWDTKDVQDVDI
eukprot:457690_1